MQRMLFATTSLFVFTLSSGAGAQPLTLLQDEVGIECTSKSKNSDIEKIEMDAKDTVVTIHRKKGAKPEEFKSFRFMGSAVFAQSGKGQKLLFQIYPNSEVAVFIGDHFEFAEKSCEDTGASKKCTTESMGSLTWSPEVLGLDSGKYKFKHPVSHYGVYPKTGTFFHAVSPKPKGQPALALVDFGAPLELIVGRHEILSCTYAKQHK